MGFDIHMLRSPSKPVPGLDPDDPGYIRFGGGSMSGMAQLMYTAQVLDDDVDGPDLPDWSPSGLDEARAEELHDHFMNNVRITPEPTAEEVARFQDYCRAREEVVATRSEIPGRVPAFKFLSNEDWLVCPEECRIIANGLDRFIAVNERRLKADIDWDGVRLWATFNRVAISHGGYRVG